MENLPDKPDVQVEVKKSPQPLLVTMAQLAGVIGVGSVIGLYVVPKMVHRDDRNQDFIQQGMFDMAKESSQAMTQAADSMDDLGESIDGLVQQQQVLLQGLSPLTRELDRVADAVRAQIKQDKEQTEAAEAGQP